MNRLTTIRTLLVSLTIVVLSTFTHAVERSTAHANQAPKSIVIGFVGGFVNSDNPHHGPVQLAQRIRHDAPDGTYVQVFENRHRRQAYNTVFNLLDTNRDGVLSAEEKNLAHIVLFGHSWGASAAVELARDLHRVGVPVLLTVQVDSVAKWWQNDHSIPSNVAEAANFYQTQGVIHGRRVIKAEDPTKTAILGNYLVDYRKISVYCPDASLWDRVFTPGHMQSECDRNLWSQVENLVRQRIAPQSNTASVSRPQEPRPAR